MKSRQLGFVLMALIAVGLAGLIVKVISSGSDEVALSGLFPLAPEVVDKVTMSSEDSEVDLVRRGDSWSLEGRYPLFVPKFNAMWDAVSEMEGAQLVSTNPANHSRMGVAEGTGTTVSFFLGRSLQERFVIGKWTADVRLCYIRRAGKEEVYGIPCLAAGLFGAEQDGWRDPVIVAIPIEEIEAVSFTYPDDEFALAFSDGLPVIISEGEELDASFIASNSVLTLLSGLPASGFASDEEAEGLEFDKPDALVRVSTFEEAPSRPASLRFIQRDEGSYYVRIATQSTVFILEKNVADALLIGLDDFVDE